MKTRRDVKEITQYQVAIALKSCAHVPLWQYFQSVWTREQLLMVSCIAHLCLIWRTPASVTYWAWFMGWTRSTWRPMGDQSHGKTLEDMPDTAPGIGGPSSAQIISFPILLIYFRIFCQKTNGYGCAQINRKLEILLRKLWYQILQKKKKKAKQASGGTSKPRNVVHVCTLTRTVQRWNVSASLCVCTRHSPTL